MKFSISSRNGIALALVGSAYLIGFVTSEFNLFPYRYLVGAGRRVAALIAGRKPGAPDVRSIETIHLSLRVETAAVPVGRAGSGGGLTSVEDELLVLSHDGEVFLASGTEIKKTRIGVPDNGAKQYRKAAQSPKYRDRNHTPERLRYNDILYYRNEDLRALVISYTEFIADKECYGSTIARLKLPSEFRSILDVGATSEEWETIYRTQPWISLEPAGRVLEGHMAGGRMAFRPPDTIVFGSGDYHLDGVYVSPAIAQLPENDYGKVLEISLKDGSVRTVSVGHRNPQGVLIDSGGQLWVVEHGPRGGDELNRVLEGGNYGWPLETLGTRYDGLPWPTVGEQGRHGIYLAPTYAWVPSVGISSLAQIRGFHPTWDGDLLAGSLIGRTLFRLRLENQRVVFAEPVPVGERVRDVHQHTNGKIYLWTDSNKLAMLSAEENTSTQSLIDEKIESLPYTESQQQKIRTTLDGCQECHSFGSGVQESAPVLGDVYGRQIASTDFAQYSPALLATKGSWSADALRAYIRDPQGYVPGTSMPGTGVEDPVVVDGIVEVLRKLKDPGPSP